MREKKDHVPQDSLENSYEGPLGFSGNSGFFRSSTEELMGQDCGALGSPAKPINADIVLLAQSLWDSSTGN